MMTGLFGLAFVNPWLLAGLAILPALWWLLRVTPPAPRQMNFPPLRFLLALRPAEQTPARTPWWLVLLRMLAATLIILALAGPVMNPGVSFHGSGPLLLVIDNGWASATEWQDRQRKINEILDQAARQERQVLVLLTAPESAHQPLQVSNLMRASDARGLVGSLTPKPWPTERGRALDAVRSLQSEGSVHTVWIADGIGNDDASALADYLQSLGSLTVIESPADERSRLILEPEADGEGLVVPVTRVPAAGRRDIVVRAVTEDNRLISRATGQFGEGEGLATMRMSLPGELRNRIARLEVEGARNAGETFLMDERWRRRPVGIVSGGVTEAEQPLLSSMHFLERALRPFAEVRQGSVSGLLQRELAVLVLADVGQLLESDLVALEAWMSDGGVVLRFAGPLLAAAADRLTPVPLRGGGRVLGGAMSWAEPATLLPFRRDSPFFGLPPPPDVQVHTQVLAEPGPVLDRKTWARLTDGTPLVTADRRGRGWLILVHTTANTDWSNLPLSGLFVEMLQRVVALSTGVVGEDPDAHLPPFQSLDGFGRLGPPIAGAMAIAATDFSGVRPTPTTPPGYYGRENGRRALNLAAAMQDLQPIGELPVGVERLSLTLSASLDFKPWLLLSALLIVLADMVISLMLRGLLGLPRLQGRATAAIFVAGVFMAGAGDSLAQETGADSRALAAALEVRLAYVETGDGPLDRLTRSGLQGLTDVLRRRTSVEPGPPVAVNLETDELAFFPMLYWAVSPRQRVLSEIARRKLNSFVKTGGTVLFDTREQGRLVPGAAGSGSAGLQLRRILRGLDVPLLTRVPPDHVLTKTFYLLDDFPGRWAGGAVWVEKRGGRHNDGVSPFIIGSNDWAGAWAIDEDGRPLSAVVPGGARQREMAYRFGVNWVMYALTGNYKTDQVHVPAILDRLGQ